MDEDTEYVKLPVEDRCVHKLWKARIHGYEEATKLFQITEEKSPEWNKFLGLLKKFVVDSHAAALDKGLEATLAYVENSGVAGKTVNDVMSGVVAKCIGAPKAKTKDLAMQISLMFIEREKQELVLEELLKGTEHKNPKVVASCINVITQAIREFGVKVINVKPVLKKIPGFLEDRDKTVREEGKLLAIEIYRWIGPALKPQLDSLKPIQVTELETEFAKVKNDKGVPSRYLRSQQAKQAKIAAEAANDPECGDDCVDDRAGNEEIDPYELMDPVDILSKLPKDFYEKLEAKKWQERKEAMETLEGLLKSAPKLENGDYFELVKALKKVIGKDSNVVVVTLAAKNMAGLASGLKKRYQQYAQGSISVILEKFREKKATVVAALREAIDAVYPSTTLETILEDVIGALENKNPSVKSESASFLARCFTKCTPAILNKKILKALCTVLLKTLNESDPIVRDSSADALGTAMKVVGEKAMLPFLADVDSLKMSKIKEFYDKAEIVVKQPRAPKPAASTDRPTTAPSKQTAAGSLAPKPVKKPVKKPGAAPAQPVKKAASASNTRTKNAKIGLSAFSKPIPTERELSDEEVQEQAEEFFAADVMSGLSDTNWKLRLEAVEKFSKIIGTLDQNKVSAQLLFKIINKKPGFKDTNIQVAKLRLECLKSISTNFMVSSVAMSCVLLDVTDRIGDPKLGPLVGECLTAIAEATKLDIVSNDVLDYAFNSQKSPKVQVEVLNWLSNAIQEFGFQVQPKALMENVKKGVGATNPTVRTASISLLGTLYVYMGPQLSLFFENEKAALLQQINAEFEKHAGETPKNPIRGVRKAHSQGDLLDDNQEADEIAATEVNIQDIVPRKDITTYITDTLVSEMVDKNWKVRAEALEKFKNIVSELRFISGSLGEAAPALAARLVDSNSKIAATAIALCQQIAKAYGSSCKQYVRTFFPGLLQGMGDSKVWIRTASVECINTYGDLCGFRDFFDGEMIYDALKGGSPTLRTELWAWLASKLPTMKTVPKEELLVCLPILFSNIEDRNADVRKNASEAIVGIMTHVGYGPMMTTCGKLRPASSSQISVMLDRARGSIPEKSMTKAKSTQSINKIGKDNGSNTIVKSSSKTKVNPNAKTSSSSIKKKEDEDLSPLLQVNNLKNQRSIDEQKLKTLKWNFTTPREEFVDLLRDQMNTANVNKGLIANMFHSDFKYHLRAIESLSEDLPNNPAALTSNLDLILKWMTLRFFDTNPSVILKGLEYLQTVFKMLSNGNYAMLENEASSFIPYLVVKVGDPKDAVRNSVHILFKQISLVYPVQKLFTYIMDGLKSKNARQRSECLEQLGYLIEEYGLNVCQPTPAAALKEIARHISDRDNSVRNGAINCVVIAYFLGGERILKMVGQISEKDMSLLEERIKRAAKSRVAVATVKPIVQSHSNAHVALQPAPSRRSITPEPDNEPEEELQENNSSPMETPPRPQPEINRRFGLKQEFTETVLDSNGLSAEVTSLNLKVPDLTFLMEPVVAPITKPEIKLNASSSLASKVTNMTTIEWHLSQIGSQNYEKALNAINQVETMLSSDQQRENLIPFTDNLLSQLLNHLVLLGQCNHPDVVNFYKSNLRLFMKVYSYPDLCYKVSEPVIKRVVEVILKVLSENKLHGQNLEMFNKVINNLVLQILMKSEPNNVVCSLLKVLHGTVNNPSVTQLNQELVMKCLWKVIKSFSDWKDKLDFERIFTDVHIFLVDYPSSWWKSQPQDIPLRTVKTVIHTLLKIRGHETLNYVKKVKGVKSDSEIYIYTTKLLKTIKIVDHTGDGPHIEKKSAAKPRHLSKSITDQLTEIFSKIGKKSESQEGLRMLYEFQQLHPEADTTPFLQNTAPYFQNFIKKGLEEIEMEKKGARFDNLSSNLNKMTINEKDEVVNCKFDAENLQGQNHLQQLNMLRIKTGLQPWTPFSVANNNSPSPPASSYVQSSENCDVNTDIQDLSNRSINLDTSSNSVNSGDHSPQEADFKSIKQRLAKLKQGLQ